MVKTTNLEAAITTVLTNLDDMPIDQDVLDTLIERFESIIPLIPLSAYEAYETGQVACMALHSCACRYEKVGRGDRADELECINRDFHAALRTWYVKAYEAERSRREFWCDPNIRDSCVARWESRGGAHWVELWSGPYDYHYVSGNGCGSICHPNHPVESAVLVMQAMLARGRFLPDDAKLPMKRVR